MSILVVLICSALSAVAYRMGGSGRYSRLWRIIGVPGLTVLATWGILGVSVGLWWAYVLYLGLMVGAISTYWDFLTGGRYDNYWFHGFVLGLAAFPLIWCGVPWYCILLRSMALAVFMGVWCLAWKWDIAEETGRGAVIPLSLLLLTI